MAKDDLKLLLFLPPPENWDCKPVPPHLTLNVLTIIMTSLATYAHWCSAGMSVWGVTTTSWWIYGLLHKAELRYGAVNRAKNLWLGREGPQERTYCYYCAKWT